MSHGPTPTETVVQKAISAVSNLATDGKFPDEMAMEFIDRVVDLTEWKNVARIVRPKATWKINKIGIGQRVTVPADEGKDINLRRNATTSSLTLTPAELMVAVDITKNFTEENIEGDRAKEHVLNMFKIGTAQDVEEMLVHGDTTGPAATEDKLLDSGNTSQVRLDTLLALRSGLLKQALSGHVVDAAGAAIGPQVFDAALDAMPQKFQRSMNNLRFLMPTRLYQKWLLGLSGRPTAIGDNALTNGSATAKAFGIDLTKMPLFQFQPSVVKHVVCVNDATAASLGFAPIVDGSVVVTTTGLGKQSTTPMVEDTDYTINYSTGTITKVGGTIADGQTVKVTFQTYPQMILTPKDNIVVAIGRDITIDSQYNIHTRSYEFVITLKVDFSFEEPDAVVLVKNISTTSV